MSSKKDVFSAVKNVFFLRYVFLCVYSMRHDPEQDEKHVLHAPLVCTSLRSHFVLTVPRAHGDSQLEGCAIES